MMRIALMALVFVLMVCGPLRAQQAKQLEQAPNTWVKRSPLKDAPLSPMLGYEGSFGYDPKARLLIRFAGHNQSGGGEQNAETWTFDPVTAKWTLKEPNTSPPGACCNAQNVFDPLGGRFVRFPAFSGSHGWHWFRENYLNNSSVWTYELPTNTWRDMRPVPAVQPAPLRCASWDSDHQVVVLFGGEGATHGTIVYDPYDNSWSRMFPPTEPKGRSAGNMAYHKEMKKHFLFGSQFTDDPHTWAYDLVKNEWTDLQPARMPSTKENDAVLAYDEINKTIVASIRAPAGDGGDDGWRYETWVYEHTKNAWSKLNPAVEPPGGGQRRRIMAAIPDQNVILMENYVNPPQKIPGVDREQQIWTYRFAAPKETPAVAPPTMLKVESAGTNAVLRWEGGAPSQWILRRDEGFRTRSVKPDKEIILRGDSRRHVDENLEPGRIYYYSIAAVDEQGKRSAFTDKVRTQPRLVLDVHASVQSATEVTVTWPALKGEDVIGYHVERASVEVFSEDQIYRLRNDTASLHPAAVGAIRSIGKFEKLTRKPIADTKFTDIGINLAKPAVVKEELYRHRFGSAQIYEEGEPYRFGVYAYRVRAVGKLGVESGGGPYALTIPSAPQAVFSKEDGTQCHLKWETNREQNITGYHVYRMNSPRINGPGQVVYRLTREPVKATSYLDANAGQSTCRYWIIAVDALGQEGYPSAPTWHERQFKKNYLPFTGAWHQ